MAETFGRMATISDMESTLSAGKADATLWETEEQALRFLMEDGKLNICLRSLMDFKKGQIEARKTGKGAMLDYTPNCDKFEKGLGTILRNAWQHVEVLQTTDLPALIHHIADTFEAALATREVVVALGEGGDLHQRQEVLVYYYLDGMMRRVEDIREGRIMPIIRERGLFMLGVRVLQLIAPHLLPSHTLKAAQALSGVAETEDYSTYTEAYINPSSLQDVESITSFKDEVLGVIMGHLEQRRLIRPLVDAIDKAKRLAARQRK
mmetsp:Transcript_14390/g.31516  ORF Transcript_14390/g.31516 Transcript_14390/m.31516 type:complete len:264 (+) Transcript_14390:363-1154(+)